jgi:hypothetical protein
MDGNMIDPFAPTKIEPSTMMIGRYRAWSIALDLDNSLFGLKYVVTWGPGSNKVEIPGVMRDAIPGRWLFAATSDLTRQIAHGDVTFDLIVTRISDGEQSILRTFSVTAFSDDVDRRTHAEIMVKKIESILQGRADSDVSTYSIKSRSITKMTIPELTDWREYYLAEIGRQINPVTGKRKSTNSMTVRFI